VYLVPSLQVTFYGYEAKMERSRKHSSSSSSSRFIRPHKLNAVIVTKFFKSATREYSIFDIQYRIIVKSGRQIHQFQRQFFHFRGCFPISEVVFPVPGFHGNNHKPPKFRLY
jgi:hypothetical protein